MPLHPSTFLPSGCHIWNRMFLATLLLTATIPVLQKSSTTIIPVSAFSNAPAVYMSFNNQRRKRKNPSTHTRLAADVSFSGDSQAWLELEAPIDRVLEWLLDQPEASDLHLLGSSSTSSSSSSTNYAAILLDPKQRLWQCPQPRIDFMGLELQPTFVTTVQRHPRKNTVIVKLVDSTTEIIMNDPHRGKTTTTTSRSSSSMIHPAHHVVGSFMGRAKFQGQSIIRVVTTTTAAAATTCVLQVDLSLTLHIPLPPFVLLPPGFNSIGSSIVQRTGKSRTLELLQNLKAAYGEWDATVQAEAEFLAAKSSNPEVDQTKEEETI